MKMGEEFNVACKGKMLTSEEIEKAILVAFERSRKQILSLNLKEMSMKEVRTTFKDILEVVYFGIDNSSVENKLKTLKNAMGGKVRFTAYGGNETPELELNCLEYSFIMSKLDKVL